MQAAAGSARADGETDTESGTGAGGGSVCGGSSGGAQCGSACGACTYVWSLSLPACVSAESGRVGVSFFFYAVSGEVMAAASVSFLVEAGAAAPSVPTEGDAYGEVLATLAQIAGGLGDGAYPARSLRLWREGVQYDAGEVVLCTGSAEGGSNLVRSLQDSNAQPPYTDGVLGETWEEVYSFEGAIQPFASFFAELALSKIVWAAQLPEEGESGTLYAVLSSSDASLFALYVFRDGEWVSLGEKNVSVLPNGGRGAVHRTAADKCHSRHRRGGNIGAVSEEQLAAGLNGLAAVLSEGEACPRGYAGGRGASISLRQPRSATERPITISPTPPSLRPDWTVVSGGGTAPVFGDDGLTIAEGLFAERGAVAAANPLIRGGACRKRHDRRAVSDRLGELPERLREHFRLCGRGGQRKFRLSVLHRHVERDGRAHELERSGQPRGELLRHSGRSRRGHDRADAVCADDDRGGDRDLLRRGTDSVLCLFCGRGRTRATAWRRSRRSRRQTFSSSAAARGFWAGGTPPCTCGAPCSARAPCARRKSPRSVRRADTASACSSKREGAPSAK